MKTYWYQGFYPLYINIYIIYIMYIRRTCRWHRNGNSLLALKIAFGKVCSFLFLAFCNCWRTVGNSPLKQNWDYCLNFTPSTQNFSVWLVKQKGVSVGWGSASTLFSGTEENYFLFLINWGFSSVKHLSIYWAFNGSPIAFNLEEFTFVTTSA